MSYVIPPGTHIGHVHLKVSSIDRSLSFYKDLLGFQVTVRYGTSAVFLSAGGYHHHIGLNTWHSKNAAPVPVNGCGLYHAAIVFETRKELAAAVKRLLDVNYPLSGAADHGVSEAIYLNDPDENGVELYWDRPRELWPKSEDGNLEMLTAPLDMEDLLKEINR